MPGPTDIVRNIPGFEDAQQRVVAATYGDIRLICAYFPNGQAPDSDKFVYKLKWLEAMTAWLREELAKYPRLALLGDFNIAPEDRDVHDPAKWEGQNLVSPQERAAFAALVELGLATRSASSSSRKRRSPGGTTACSRSGAMPGCASTISCCHRRWRMVALPA